MASQAGGEHDSQLRATLSPSCAGEATSQVLAGVLGLSILALRAARSLLLPSDALPALPFLLSGQEGPSAKSELQRLAAVLETKCQIYGLIVCFAREGTF